MWKRGTRKYLEREKECIRNKLDNRLSMSFAVNFLNTKELEVSRILMKAMYPFSDIVHKIMHVRVGSHFRNHLLYESLLLSQKNEHQALFGHYSAENSAPGKKPHSTLNRSDYKETRSVPYFESDLSLLLLCICSYFTIWSHKDKSESSKM